MAEKAKPCNDKELQAISDGSSLQVGQFGADGSGSLLAGWLGTTAFMSVGLGAKKNLPPAWDTKPLPSRGGKGVLVIGMGRETSGDNGVGIYLMRCLSQLQWPQNVRFVMGSECLRDQASNYDRVILLDSVEGPDSPGSLYQLDPEEMLSKVSGGAPAGLEMAALLPPWVRSRMCIFGVQPRTRHAGTSLSPEVLGALPILVTYLRGVILRTASQVKQLN